MRLRWVLFAAALSAACDSDNSANHRPVDGGVDGSDGGTQMGTGGSGPVGEGGVRPEAGPPPMFDTSIKLVESDPADGARNVPGTAWVVLRFDDAARAKTTNAVALGCGKSTPAIDVDARICPTTSAC
jgi:hypothetical protein